MITGEQKSRIDKLWEEFWTGGITNPLTVIEQISYLIFLRMIDKRESDAERKKARTKATVTLLYGKAEQHLRWSQLRTETDPSTLLKRIRDEVFPHLRTLGREGSALRDHNKDAQLFIQKPSLLDAAMRMVDALPLDDGDVKGDLYEYLLSKLTTAGINGQFRTPRHIIKFMVEMMAPQPTEVVGDPACGTAGFLVAVKEYLDKHGHSDVDRYRQHIQEKMFHGFDFDRTMLHIASMNLALHGVEEPNIRSQDSLSSNFVDRYPGLAKNAFDVILANPPFKGSLDDKDVAADLLRVVKTKKTELLFLALILRMLKPTGGRSATIVPDGVLFGSSNAHKEVRRALVEENTLQGVISLPSGVFKPYAGVSTAILVFARGGATEEVFFYDLQADGYSLDDKRQEVKENDLPDALERWKKRNGKKDKDRTAKHFVVPVGEIREKDFDLSINRYKEAVHEVTEHEPPKKIIGRLRELEKQIANDLQALERML